MKISATVTRKLGPLPAWAWLLVLAGGFLAYRHVRANREQSLGGQFSLPAVRAATPSAPSGDESASGGGGPALPELPSDLLAQFLSHQTATIDNLTAALIGTPAAAAAPVEGGAPPGASSQEGPAAEPVQVAGTSPETPYTVGSYGGSFDIGDPGASVYGNVAPYAYNSVYTSPTQPAVQPALDLYTSDNAMVTTQQPKQVGAQAVAA